MEDGALHQSPRAFLSDLSWHHLLLCLCLFLECSPNSTCSSVENLQLPSWQSFSFWQLWAPLKQGRKRNQVSGRVMEARRSIHSCPHPTRLLSFLPSFLLPSFSPLISFHPSLPPFLPSFIPPLFCVLRNPSDISSHFPLTLKSWNTNDDHQHKDYISSHCV